MCIRDSREEGKGGDPKGWFTAPMFEILKKYSDGDVT